MSKIEARLKKLEDTVSVTKEVFHIDIVTYGDGELPPDKHYTHENCEFHIHRIRHQPKPETE